MVCWELWLMRLWHGFTTSWRPAWAVSRFPSKIKRRFLQPFFLFSVCALGLAGISGCAKNLVTKRHQVKFISQKTEIEIGKKAKEQIVKEYGIYKDLDWQI